MSPSAFASPLGSKGWRECCLRPGVGFRESVVLLLDPGVVLVLVPGVGHQGVAGGRSGSPPLPQPGPLLPLLLLLLLLLSWWIPYPCHKFSGEVSLLGLVFLLDPDPGLAH